MPVKKYWRVAQQVERETVNLVVVGSSPTVSADVPDIYVGDIQKKKNRRIKNNEKNKTKTEGKMPKTEY